MTKKNVKITVNGLPVEIEVTSKESVMNSIKKCPVFIKDNMALRIVKIGDDSSSKEEIEKTQSDVLQLISSIIEVIQNNKDNTINIFQSKTFWVNIVALVSIVGLRFGIDFGLTTEQTTSIASLIVLFLSLINIYLRKKTTRLIK